ncbi:MAG: transglycosylase SLT domain-containing protein [archaeon]|nr:transglycosylase SLT domain-containing protein [archaeon]
MPTLHKKPASQYTGISRRDFLKSAGVGFLGAFFGRRAAAQEVAVHRHSLPSHPPMKQSLKVYRLDAKLKGKELADAYKVEYTKGPGFAPSPELEHDVRVLVARECSRYNQKIEGFNPEGKELVDPYVVLSILKVESRFNPNAHKERDGRGIAQLTGIAMKELESIENYPVFVGNPYDMELAIMGCVRYLVHVKQEHKNVNPITAYRLGPSGAKDPKYRKIAVDYAAKVLKARNSLKNALEGYI